MCVSVSVRHHQERGVLVTHVRYMDTYIPGMNIVTVAKRVIVIIIIIIINLLSMSPIENSVITTRVVITL